MIDDCDRESPEDEQFTRYKNLGIAVIARAISDVVSNGKEISSSISKIGTGQMNSIKEKAIQFLVGEGEYREINTLFFGMAGINPPKDRRDLQGLLRRARSNLDFRKFTTRHKF